ncbi:GtrA family protein [Halospeciosus flavus]
MGQFFSVGVLGAVVDTLALLALVEVLGVAPTPAKIGSAEASICLMFVLNEFWTFQQVGERDPWAVLRRFGKSNLVRWVGAGIALVVLHVLTQQFGVWYLLANVAGIGVGFVANYVFESLLTWKVSREEPISS